MPNALKELRQHIRSSASDSAMVVGLGYFGQHQPTPEETKAANAARVQKKTNQEKE